MAGSLGRTRNNLVGDVNPILVKAYFLAAYSRVDLALSTYYDDLLREEGSPNLDDLINADLNDLDFDLYQLNRKKVLEINDDLASTKNRTQKCFASFRTNLQLFGTRRSAGKTSKCLSGGLNRPLFGFKSINWSRRRVFGWCSN
jgi:hypothetical protein